MSPRSSAAGPHGPIAEHCVTRLHTRVRFGETDLMVIVHHGSYVGYLEAGRVEYLRRRGFPYQQMIDRGYHMPVVEMNLRYKKPARFDELIVIETRLGALTRVTVRFDYQLYVAHAGNGDARASLICTAHTLLACVDPQNRLRQLPQDVVDLLFLQESGADSVVRELAGQ
jgi:acyl-CoA thioester hydrolase